MPAQPILVWLRNDLRLHDHEPLHAAAETGASVVPVYCFDPRDYATTEFGFAKTGNFRAQFIRESVADLRRSLQQRGSNLVVRRGKPEEVIPTLARELDAAAVFYYLEATAEEQGIERTLLQTLQADGITAETFWGHTLVHIEDLPYEVSDLPEIFTQFRTSVERCGLAVRDPLPTPSTFPPLPQELAPGEIPTLAEVGLEPVQQDPRTAINHQGGESEALARLETYIWERDRLKSYKETRNGMLGEDYSSKFSAWLSRGCLSPRMIYSEVQRYEAERTRNDSTYWLVFELLWRDYFRLIAVKHGAKLFKRTGLRGMDLPWTQDRELFKIWQEGRTGYPLVDANMREFSATGFMSNRGRQNVASFLTKNLNLDWRMGAEWFESLLIDYDVSSNWGNWNYTAGVGNDARGFRFFNITKQSRDYDADGAYVKHWLPELKQVPVAKIHEPWKLTPAEQQRYEIQLGVDYPEPIVDLFASADENERLYNRAAGIKPKDQKTKTKGRR